MTRSVRGLARNSLVFAVANALPRLGSFILLPIYTRYMDPAALGIVSLMISLATLLSILFRLGQEPALLRLHFDYEGSDRGRLYWSAFLITSITGSFAVVGLTAVLSGTFHQLFAEIAWMPYGVVALGIALGNSLMFIPLAWLRAEERAAEFAAFTALIFGVIAGTTLVLIIPLGLDALGALLAQAVGAAVVAIFAIVLLLRMKAVRMSVDASSARELLAFGLPLVPHATSVWVLGVSDRWMIAGLSAGGPAHAQAQVGIYWLGYQLASGISLLAAAVQAAWTPTLFRHGATAAGADAFSAVTTVTSLAFVLLAAAAGIFAPEIIGIVAGGDYAGAIPVLRISAFAALGYAIYMMTVGAVMLTRRTRPLALITTVSAVANVLLNVLLIPTFGISGAAWASVVGYAGYAVATTLYARRIFAGRIDAVRVSGAVATAGLSVALASAVDILKPELLRVTVAGLIFGVVATVVLLLVQGPYRDLAASIGRMDRESPSPTPS